MVTPDRIQYEETLHQRTSVSLTPFTIAPGRLKCCDSPWTGVFNACTDSDRANFEHLLWTVPL